ncbi:MAG: AlpA family phage regulatory protein [Methylococcaceae bacterium]
MASSDIKQINPLRRIPFVKEATGFGRSMLYRNIQKGLFTKPVKLGARSAWPQHEIEAINRAHIAGKTDEEIRAIVIVLMAARTEEAA